MQVTFQTLFDLNSSHLTLSRQLLHSYCDQWLSKLWNLCQMASACTQFSISQQLLRTNTVQVLIVDLIICASFSSNTITLTGSIHISQTPSSCFGACFAPEWHVPSLPLLQLKEKHLYYKMDSHFQTAKVRSAMCVCVHACIFPGVPQISTNDHGCGESR